MKSFFDLIKTNKKFGFYLIIFIAFLVWAWIKGFRIVVIIMAVLVLSAIIVNLWKTK
ncbi:MAG: hypothetical protein R6U26_04305 [Candidatus Undinarchaeales archaeon]